VLSADIDSANAVKTIIFVINARQLYKPKPTDNNETPSGFWALSYYFGIWSAKTKPSAQEDPLTSLINKDAVGAFCSLVNACAAVLKSTHQYKDSKFRNPSQKYYSNPWKIVVTHMDMIPLENKKEFRKQLEQSTPYHASKFTYGEKECEWNEKDLQNHEAYVKGLLDKVGEGQDYTEVLKHEELNRLHISEDDCIRPNCKHNFTEETLEKISRYNPLFQRRY